MVANNFETNVKEITLISEISAVVPKSIDIVTTHSTETVGGASLVPYWKTMGNQLCETMTQKNLTNSTKDFNHTLKKGNESPSFSSSTSSSSSTTTGLDMLMDVALRTAIDNDVPHQLKRPSSGKPKQSRKKEVHERIYIDQVHDLDVLCGRGGRSNHHPGNKRYRQLVSDMKFTYKNAGERLKKTDMSHTVVDYVRNYGGRFIKKDKTTGQYYLLTRKEAQRKTSQALREHKDIKWMT